MPADTVGHALQVPMSADLRKAAEAQAREQGFSSLQAAVRVFLKKLADRAIGLKFEEPTIQLSQKAIRRYNKIDEDVAEGKNVYAARDVKDLMRQLRETPLS